MICCDVTILKGLFMWNLLDFFSISWNRVGWVFLLDKYVVFDALLKPHLKKLINRELQD